MPIGAVVAALVILVGVFVYLSRQPSAPPAKPRLDVTGAVIYQATHVPPSVFTEVGANGVSSPFKSTKGASPLAGSGGKPELLYEGAEFCPFCAAERWSLIAALSRFGTFSGLALNRSSANDSFPNTVTFTFRSAKFSSPYLDFVTVEMSDRNGSPLQSQTEQQRALMTRYDSGDYIPFIDVGNRLTTVGGWPPSMLAGQSWQQVAGALSDPHQAGTKAIISHANYLVGAICLMTGQKPGSVCSAPEVRQIQAQIGK